MPRSEQRNEQIRSVRREQILEAALTLYLQLGFHGTDMDAIASEAGLAKGLLYYYFKTKRDLFAALYTRMLNKADAFSAQLFSDTRGQSPVDRLMRYTHGLFCEGEDNLRLMRFCIRIPFDAYAVFGPEGWREGVRKSDVHRRALTEIMAQGMVQGAIPAADPSLAANSFWSVFVANAVAYAKLIEGRPEAPTRAADDFQSVVQFCFQGLGIERAVWTAALHSVRTAQTAKGECHENLPE